MLSLPFVFFYYCFTLYWLVQRLWSRLLNFSPVDSSNPVVIGAMKWLNALMQSVPMLRLLSSLWCAACRASGWVWPPREEPRLDILSSTCQTLHLTLCSFDWCKSPLCFKMETLLWRAAENPQTHSWIPCLPQEERKPPEESLPSLVCLSLFVHPEGVKK